MIKELQKRFIRTTMFVVSIMIVIFFISIISGAGFPHAVLAETMANRSGILCLTTERLRPLRPGRAELKRIQKRAECLIQDRKRWF